MRSSSNDLVRHVIEGDRRAIARAISRVENGTIDSDDLLRQVYPNTGGGYRIGITGPPGGGKSTLTNRLAKLYRSHNLRVGVIAVDPTSPFTGGALLGDRVRMTDVELDEGVFIRSMASRGSLGGLSRKAKEAADILDAAGYDIVLMETVGVGQSELDVASATDTTVVVLVPESGDGVQAMKAGLMEIADFFVMNKSDRPGAEQAVMSIKLILGFKPREKKSIDQNTSWTPDVVQTVASEGKGIEDVAGLIERHREALTKSGGLGARRKTRLEERVKGIIDEKLHVDFWSDLRRNFLKNELGRVLDREETPYDLAEKLIGHFRNDTEKQTKIER